jgi:hypothetical protein
MGVKMVFGWERMMQYRDYISSNFPYQRRCMKQGVEKLAS